MSAPVLAAGIDSGLTAESPSPSAGLSGMGQRLEVFDSMRRCNRVWCKVGPHG